MGQIVVSQGAPKSKNLARVSANTMIVLGHRSVGDKEPREHFAASFREREATYMTGIAEMLDASVTCTRVPFVCVDRERSNCPFRIEAASALLRENATADGASSGRPLGIERRGKFGGQLHARGVRCPARERLEWMALQLCKVNDGVFLKNVKLDTNRSAGAARATPSIARLVQRTLCRGRMSVLTRRRYTA
ncbi:MAG: hypothetical protein M3365_06715 [Gemmatimonadota bacterium]|nr:hypothetical protein [Gemmatimonadota bacterium]